MSGPEDASGAPDASASKFRAGETAIWADNLGRASIRSVQVLLVTALVGVIVWAATRVPLVLTPVLIALILASAISPSCVG
ncbi:hypothetical protein [Arthrobacter sp. A5]|uniref:hypothetical protein n=1 Tax=Arthrobacter sp. A5 TaxID=576926 RepID=UPI003DA804BB